MTPPTQDQFILPESVNQDIFLQFIEPTFLRFSKPVDTPTVVFLAGQPGSGKSSLAAYHRKQFDDTGDGVVTINSDELREFHPDYAMLQRSFPDHASFLVQPDSAIWQVKLITSAIADQRNTVLDGTLGGPVERVLDTMRAFRQAGYRVMVSVMAVPAYQSRLGIYQRYADQVRRKGHGRWVGRRNHDQVYAQLPERIDYLEQQRAVDQIVVFARPIGDQPPGLIYENSVRNGGWVHELGAKQALETYRNRLLTYAEYKTHKVVALLVQGDLELDSYSSFSEDIRQTAIRCREATNNDVLLYYDWANDPITRQQSFNSTPISLETHRAWFVEKLADADASLFVFETSDGTPIGQVRFEGRYKGVGGERVVVTPWDEAVISISLDAQFRGKGLAPILIEEACTSLFQQKRLSVPMPIIAYIKPTNPASINAFERAGFIHRSTNYTEKIEMIKLNSQPEKVD